jgi:hypothetical protein
VWKSEPRSQTRTLVCTGRRSRLVRSSNDPGILWELLRRKFLEQYLAFAALLPSSGANIHHSTRQTRRGAKFEGFGFLKSTRFSLYTHCLKRQVVACNYSRGLRVLTDYVLPSKAFAAGVNLLLPGKQFQPSRLRARLSTPSNDSDCELSFRRTNFRSSSRACPGHKKNDC